MTQKTFSDLAWDKKERVTRRERFLSEMDAVIPWKDFERLISPHTPRVVPSSEGGRPGYPARLLLRIHFCQAWYQLSDEGVEDTLYDSESVRRFCLGTASIEGIPDASTIRRFRHLLEKHELQKKLFSRLGTILSEKGIVTKSGTIVDATIISAPSSIKNSTETRDPEMSQTKKGNEWFFGMKCHIGVDEESGVVHTAVPSTAKDHDIIHIESLLHGDESVVIGDRAYVSEDLAETFKAEGVQLLTPKKKPFHGALTKAEKRRNCKLAARRAAVEHPFRTIKVLFGYRKTRYRGLLKNFLNQLTLLLLSNLHKLRHHPQLLRA